MFIWILSGLFCLSFLLSVFSLWKDLRKNIKTEHVTEELSKGRVIFHAPSASDAYKETNAPVTQSPTPTHTGSHAEGIPSYHPEEPVVPPLEAIVETTTEALPTDTNNDKDKEV